MNEIQQIKIPELPATMYSPAKKGLSLLVLGGSGGGSPEKTAAFFASQGYPAMALPYFGVEGLPRELVHIPLETVERAIQYLATDVAVYGISKGAELALLAATKFPQIKAVVANMPSAMVFPGISATGGSSWMYRGEPIPCANPAPAHILEKLRQDREAGRRIEYREFYESRLTPENDHALIPVETILAPILLFSGGRDTMWPSDRFADLIARRAPQATHISFAERGHDLSLLDDAEVQKHTFTFLENL